MVSFMKTDTLSAGQKIPVFLNVESRLALCGHLQVCSFLAGLYDWRREEHKVYNTKIVIVCCIK
jgi:hypothetical protein